MATTITCDRCNRVISNSGDYDYRTSIEFGNDSEIHKDLCSSCRAALKNFFEPLPREG